MYKVLFYRNNKGEEPVLNYLNDLKNKKGKDSRIRLNKIGDYIQALQEYGTYLGANYLKHLDGEIWELRPLDDRILFAAFDGNNFVLLHQFRKKTRKTPRREIEKAKKEYIDFIRRK